MNNRFSTNTMLVINLSASLILNSSISIAADKSPATHSNKNAVIATTAGLATGASVIYTTGEQLKAHNQSLAQTFAKAETAAPPTPSFPRPTQAFDNRPLSKGDIFVAEGIDGTGRKVRRTIVVAEKGKSYLTPESLVQLFKDKFENFTPKVITARIQMTQPASITLANTVHDTATKKLAAGAGISIVVAGVTYYLLEKHANQEKIAEAGIRHLSPQQSPNNKSAHGKDYDKLLPSAVAPAESSTTDTKQDTAKTATAIR